MLSAFTSSPALFLSPSVSFSLLFYFSFSPPSFFLSLFYLFFLTGIGLQLIFHALVIFECQCQVSQSSF